MDGMPDADARWVGWLVVGGLVRAAVHSNLAQLSARSGVTAVLRRKTEDAEINITALQGTTQQFGITRRT